MPGTFQRLITGSAPPWMDHGNMGTLLESIGSQLDANNRQVLDARLAANPYANGARLATGELIQCPPFVLPIHAEQRGITLYASEPELSRRIRLSQWLQLHRERGTPWGLFDNLRPFFAAFVAAGGAYPTMRIVFQDNAATPRATWFSMAPDGTRSMHLATPSNWNWDNRPTLRTRFHFILYWPTGYANTFAWDSGPTWDSGPVWDGVPATVFADIWQAIFDWKAAHSWFGGLITTSLRPTDSIPGFPGVHPFDPTSIYTLNSDGSTNMPTGNWFEPAYSSGPYLGHNTRAPWATFYKISNGW